MIRASSKFDFNMMDSAGYGYYRVWVERSYLLKLAAIPFLIKLACTVTVMVLGYEDNILRQGLILLPGDLAEGWVLAQYLRTLLKGERWPTVLPSDMDEKTIDRLLLRARGIVAATLSYTLIALFAYFVRFCLFGQMSGDAAEGINPTIPEIGGDTPLDINPLYFIPLAAGLLAAVWSFRLMWVYIPFSVLMPLREYLKALGGFMASVKMMVLFFCSMAPVMFLMVMMSRLVFHTIGDGNIPAGNAAQFIIVFLAVLAEALVALVTTGAFVWAMRDILPKNPELLKELPKIGE